MASRFLRAKDLIAKDPVTYTESAQVNVGPCVLVAVLIGTDGVNNPTITVYDSASGARAGYEAVPTNTYDASALGLNGVVLSCGVRCALGVYLEITCAGTVEVTPHWVPWY